MFQRSLKFEEFEGKEYPFDSYIPLPGNFLRKGLVALVKSKHPGEAIKAIDPKFIEYHKIVHHPLEYLKNEL